MVNCSVNLLTQDEPKDLALKYVNNIAVVTFRLEKTFTNIAVYKSGKFSIGKADNDEKDELIQSIIQIIR